MLLSGHLVMAQQKETQPREQTQARPNVDRPIPESDGMTWVDAADVPITNMKVRIIRNLKPDLEYTTNNRGQTWRIQGETHKTIVLTHPQFTLEIHNRHDVYFGMQSRVKLPLSVSPTVTNDITGVVLGPDGKPLPHTKVRLAGNIHEQGGSGLLSNQWLLTGPDGGFAFSAQASLKTDPATLKDLHFLVDVFEPDITGPVPQRARVKIAVPEQIKIQQPPRRNITLADFEGQPIPADAAAATHRAESILFRSTSLPPGLGNITINLPDTLKSLPLQTGEYTVRLGAVQYGPADLTADHQGDLVLRSPRPAITKLTLLDGITGKPSADKTVLVSTRPIPTPEFLAYLSPEQWQSILETKTAAQASQLDDGIRTWFGLLGNYFALLKTNSQGQVDINLPRGDPSNALYVMVLGKDDFPRVTRISPEQVRKNSEPAQWKPLPAETTVYRHPVGTVVLTPERTDFNRRRPFYGTSLAIDPNSTERFSNGFPEPRWTGHPVESTVVNRVLVPAGVPVRLSLTGSDNLLYQSSLLNLAPGQVQNLKSVALKQHQKIMVRCEDSNGLTITGANFYIKNDSGKFIPIDADTRTGSFQIMVPDLGAHTLGFYEAGQTAEQEPKHQAHCILDKGRSYMATVVKFNVDSRSMNRQYQLSRIRTISFTDAFGKPMPAGTTFSLPDGQPLPNAPVLDDKGSITGAAFAKVYQSSLVISHPDFGAALLQEKENATINWAQPIHLPLANKNDADKTLMASGKVVDPDGKPMANLRVITTTAGFSPVPWHSPARQWPIQALTAKDGSFALFPNLVNITQENLKSLRQSTFPSTRIVVSAADGTDLWNFGYQGPANLGKPQTITIVKAARTFTIQPPVPRAGDYTNQFRTITFKPAGLQNAEQNTEYQLDPTTFVFNKPIPLAYGTYTVMGGFEPLVINEKSPEQIQLTRLGDEVAFIKGTVVDYHTGKPIPDSVVIGSTGTGLGNQPLHLTQEFWDHAAKLTTPFDVTKDFSREFIHLTRANTGTRTDGQGAFNLPKPKTEIYQGMNQRHITLFAMAKGYVGVAHIADTGQLTKEVQTYQYPPIKLIPSASLKLNLPDFPQTEPVRHPMSGPTAYYQLPEELTSRRVQLQARGQLRTNLALTNKVHQSDQTVTVPASVPLRMFIIGQIPPPFGINSPLLTVLWEPAQDRPINLKPAEEGTLDFKRVNLTLANFRFLKPDGEPAPQLYASWLIFKQPNQHFPQGTRTTQEGIASLQIPAGRKVTLNLMNPHATTENSVQIDHQSPDTTSDKPVTITLTKEQWEILNPATRQ